MYKGSIPGILHKTSWSWPSIVKRSAVVISIFALMSLGAGVAQSSSSAAPIRQDFEMPSSIMVPAKDGVEFNAQINGRGPFTLLFDTGSGVNILSAETAQLLGLQVEGDPLQVAAAGGYATVRRARVETLQIAGLVLHNQTFYVMALPWEHRSNLAGAVGYELWSRLAIKIDYEHQQLTFSDPASFAYSGPGMKMPLKVVDRELEVRGSVAGADGIFTLDTGNEASLVMEPGFVKKNDLVHRLQAHYHGYSGSGAAGPMPTAYYARLGTLRIGRAEVDDVISLLLDGSMSPGNKNDGNIGTGLLRQFNVVLDCTHGMLYLEKNSNWGKPGIFNRAGIVTDSITQDQKIVTILPGSPSDIAGLKVGDVILQIDGHVPSNDPLEQNDPAFLQPPGTVVRLKVKRDNAVQDFKVTLKNML
jgi:hypothetical protein